MKTFTVIGYWPDSQQRFCEFVAAADADSAETACLNRHPSLAVCGVIAGQHHTSETGRHVAFGLDLCANQE